MGNHRGHPRKGSTGKASLFSVKRVFCLRELQVTFRLVEAVECPVKLWTVARAASCAAVRDVLD